MEEEKQESDVNALGAQAVGIPSAITFQQSMPLQFAEIVAKLVQPVVFRGKLESGKNSFMDLFGGPAAHGIAAV